MQYKHLWPQNMNIVTRTEIEIENEMLHPVLSQWLSSSICKTKSTLLRAKFVQQNMCNAIKCSAMLFSVLLSWKDFLDRFNSYFLTKSMLSFPVRNSQKMIRLVISMFGTLKQGIKHLVFRNKWWNSYKLNNISTYTTFLSVFKCLSTKHHQYATVSNTDWFDLLKEHRRS